MIKKNIYISGASGFIGSHVVNYLLENTNIKPVLYKKKGRKFKIELNQSPILLKRSFTKCSIEEVKLFGIETFVHLKAAGVSQEITPKKLIYENIYKSFLDLEHAREAGIKKFIIRHFLGVWKCARQY